MMKKLKIYTAVIAMLGLLNACNDEWTEELYSQLVSFKSPITSEGVANVNLRYNKDGEVEYNLPLILSGSTGSDKDLHVKISVDNDTLGIMNYERFQSRTDLYFTQLTPGFYEFDSPTCLIAKGTHTANYKIKFKFSGLDLVERWVLPLTIQGDPSYTANRRNGWCKALLYIRPFNDYSGRYSATAMNVFFDGDSKSTVVSTRTSYVVDENSVFFYAGMVEEGAVDRGDYKIVMKFGEATENADGSKTGPLMVYATNPAINFELLNQPTYTLRKAPDATLPYLVREYCTVDIKYKYNDITSIPGRPLRFRAEGTMTMERQKNTLIPDENQAIEW